MNTHKYSWEEAIDILRNQPEHHDLIYNSYLTRDLTDNCKRFYASIEFQESLSLLKKINPDAKKVLDLPAGNGIATYAFLKEGYNVTAVDPDSSATLGREAIAHVTREEKLAPAGIVDAYGENLPFEANTFDIAYIRQGLHHAADLNRMLIEITRVLKKGGVLFATREPVVENYRESLQTFLNEQPDHKLYGGENAFTLPDYKKAISNAGLRFIKILDPYESLINLFPSDTEKLRTELLRSRTAKILSGILPERMVLNIAIKRLRMQRLPGRLFTFIAIK